MDSLAGQHGQAHLGFSDFAGGNRDQGRTLCRQRSTAAKAPSSAGGITSMPSFKKAQVLT